MSDFNDPVINNNDIVLKTDQIPYTMDKDQCLGNGKNVIICNYPTVICNYCKKEIPCGYLVDDEDNRFHYDCMIYHHVDKRLKELKLL